MIPPCDQFAHFSECVPPSLRLGRVWVGCDSNKAPKVADSCAGPIPRAASSTDPKTWRHHETALEAYGAGLVCGVGRVIRAEESLVGIDLDNCRDPESGTLSVWASFLLERLNTYSEVSPSGRGVKAWVRAEGIKRSYPKPCL
jgi:primase-polymerase (primpol)-like protein